MKPFRFLADPGPVSDGASLREAARRAEATGYSVLVFADHVVNPFGFVPLLAVAAAATDRIRVAPFVANNDLRHPALLAQDLATLDVFSDGRVEVAIGAGWNRPEYDALGIAYDPVGVRVARLAEAVTVLKAASAMLPSASPASTTRSRTMTGCRSPSSGRARPCSSAAAVGASCPSPGARRTSWASRRGP